MLRARGWRFAQTGAAAPIPPRTTRYLMTSLFRNCTLACIVGLLALSCGKDNPTELPNTSEPRFGATEPGNGTGACLLQDTKDAGFLNNPSLNCTSQDVDIAIANVTQYSFVSASGPFTPLNPGDRIGCTAGQTIWVQTSAQVINHAQARYDVGLWVGEHGVNALTGDPQTGGSCLHFNLVEGQNNSTDLDLQAGDQCGDVAANVTVDVPLGVLELSCVDDPTLTGQQVTVSACAGWLNSVSPGSRNGICPVTPPPSNDPSGGFRFGTTPETAAKCKCSPLVLPIDIKGILRIKKTTVPSADPTAFTFTPSGWNGNATFTRTDAQAAFQSELLSAGTYSAVETVPSGWALTDRACVLTGTATAKTFTSVTNGVQVALAAGEDVTCTFTDTKQAQLRIKKTTVPSADPTAFTFAPTGWNGDATFTRTDAEAAFASGLLAPGTYSAVETVPSGWALTDRACVLTGTATAHAFTSPANGVSVILAAGEDVTCTFTDTKQTQLRIKKTTVPSADPTAFTFTPTGWNGDATFTRTDAEAAFASGLLAPGTYSAVETVPSEWALTNRACVLTGTATAKTFTSVTDGVQVTLAAGEDVTCTFTNSRKARLIIRKEVVGGGTQSFDFSRTGIANFVLQTGQENNSGFSLLPGTYRVCELNLAVAWNATATLTPPGGSATLVNPDAPADLGNRCVDVVLGFGDDKTVVFTNTPPPGGEARTIGYWKNWSSCTGGQQYPTALARNEWDRTLDGNLPQTVGLLILAGAPGPNQPSPDCQKAVNILDKRSTTGSGIPVVYAKKANDAAYSLAAQLLAALLNKSADAGSCPAADAAITAAQSLLVSINFNGTGDYLGPKTTNVTLRNQALALAATLDSYNNNTLCP
jgi:Prealbumin-like fold domain